MTEHKNEAGQSMLELAIVLPILLLIVIGALDLGRAFFTVIVIANASREGARYLSVHPTDNGKTICDDGLTEPGGYCDTKDAAVREAQNSFVNINRGNVSVIPSCLDTDGVSGCDSGNPVNVYVTTNFELILGWFLPGPIALSRDTQMIVQ